MRSPSREVLKAEGYIELELKIKIVAKNRDVDTDLEVNSISL